MTKRHAELGASSAHRWVPCPGSIRLTAGIADPGSIYAAEGNAAHDVAELCLRHGQDACEYIGRIFTVGNHQFEVDGEMAEAVQVYLDTVRMKLAPGDVLYIEQEFDVSDIILPEMFGTNDAAIYRPSTGELFVFDYKHGAGYAVEVEENLQLIYYAIGAATIDPKRWLTDITIYVVQPRAFHRDGPVRDWKTDALGLTGWIAALKQAGIATQDPYAPLNPGSHCKFCRAAGVCPALREKAHEAALLEFAGAPSDLTTEQLVEILAQAKMIEDWVSAVRAHAFSILDAGGDIPGMKLVQKRAIRRWASADELLLSSALMSSLLLDDAQLFERKLRSPAQVEKLLPKHRRPALEQFVHRVSSGLTLAPESDPRPAVVGSQSGGAAADFEPVE